MIKWTTIEEDMWYWLQAQHRHTYIAHRHTHIHMHYTHFFKQQCQALNHKDYFIISIQRSISKPTDKRRTNFNNRQKLTIEKLMNQEYGLLYSLC